MKHCFVVNPTAGKGKTISEFMPETERYCKQNNLDYEIHYTTAAYEGINFVRQRAASGEHIRFYSCGGDGTLFEVVNGAYGNPAAEVAFIPLGSGNDFCKLFGTRGQFLDIDAQVKGTPADFDLIRCGKYVAINQCSMGFDAEINAKQASFKKVPFLKGKSTYMAALLYCFFKKLKNEFTISIDGGEPFTQKVLFCVAGNSRWYGGGFKAAPLALPDDGLLDFIIVKKNMNRLKLLSLVTPYKNGEHLGWDITQYRRGKKLEIHSEKAAAVNYDGEADIQNDCVFEIIEKGIKFVIPTGSSYLEDRASGKIGANEKA